MVRYQPGPIPDTFCLKEQLAYENCSIAILKSLQEISFCCPKSYGYKSICPIMKT